MEEPERRERRHGDRKQAAAPPSGESELTAGGSPLQQQPQTLQAEVGRRQAVAGSGWNRDHKVVDQARREEGDEHGRGYTESTPQRPDHVVARQHVERPLPASAPEVTKRY